MEPSEEVKDGSKGSNGNVRKDEEGDETTVPEKKMKKKDMLKDQNFISAAFLSCAEVAPNWVLWLLMTYFTQVWKESLTLSAAMVNLLEGCTAALSVLASFFAEAFPGQYLTALFSSIAYATGLVLLWSTTTSKAPKRRDALHKLFYFALGLVALGKAGASATFHPLAWNQRTDEDQKTSSCWSWRTIAVATVSLGMFITGVLVLPFLKSWKVLFGVPALTMIYASFILIAFGYVFVKEKPSESALASVPKVLLAATFNMFRPSSTGNGRCSFLEKAISSEEQLQAAPKQWLVCKEEEVKDTRALLRMVPIWTTFFAHGLVKSIGSTYFLEQANGMNRYVGKLKVPLPIFLLFFAGSVKIADSIYKTLRSDPKDPDPEKKSQRQHIPTTAIWIGAFFSVLCCVSAAAVEIRRRGVAAKHPDLAEDEPIPMTIFWLAPQYAFLGYAFGFSQRGIRGFFADQVPAAMGSYSATFVESSNGVGTILSVVVVHVIKRVTRRGGGGGWFGSTVNESRLDYFYWTLAVVSAVNLVFYTVVSRFYRYNVDGGGEGEEDLETPVA